METRGWTLDWSGDEIKGSSGEGNGNGSGSRDGIRDGNENENGEERGGEGQLWHSPHQERSTVEDQALPFHAWHHLCRQKVAFAGSQQLPTQDLPPARRCGTKGRIGHQGREGGNSDGYRYGGGHGNEAEYGSDYECRDRSENGIGNGNGNGDENRDEGGGARESGNLRSGNRDGSEDARKGATPTTKEKLQLQFPTPQRDRRIMRRIRRA